MRFWFYYFWPFYLVSSIYDAWCEHRERKRKIERLNRREDQGLPPDEDW